MNNFLDKLKTLTFPKCPKDDHYELLSAACLDEKCSKQHNLDIFCIQDIEKILQDMVFFNLLHLEKIFL